MRWTMIGVMMLAGCGDTSGGGMDGGGGKVAHLTEVACDRSYLLTGSNMAGTTYAATTWYAEVPAVDFNPKINTATVNLCGFKCYGTSCPAVDDCPQGLTCTRMGTRGSGVTDCLIGAAAMFGDGKFVINCGQRYEQTQGGIMSDSGTRYMTATLTVN